MSEIASFDQPVMMKIDKIIDESDGTKSFMFKHKIDYTPGQFIMVWLPGIDEKPFAVSYLGDDFFGITVLERGKYTKLLHKMGAGEQLGIRGPFGHGYSFPDVIADGKGSACVIGGGCGMASVTILIEKLQANNPTILMGAATSTSLFFKNRYKDIILFTDDGSEGIKGYPTDILEELHNKHKYDIVYTCGPEIMMFKVYEFCKKRDIQCEASLERYMKCGIGICGQCVCSRQMVCKDGPVFNLQTLSNMHDFGKFSLLKSGRKVQLQEYAEWRSC
ncbi:2-polyprenylphenol hydroxylase and related flavodoxin oxidoreductases [Candidatus Scalindua japonica]|uniref:2-polyprenylphenol hydroxylase and related flavodoxin oxidoreductases n=1 Tax=Candidatus Scalindua japonica TaxID=1284222 RepID=A0A286TU96_9BACT|nr:dihydroorotate dehydrogenase electron transfer subunit [Candidatus Scalindua japonica]GAX59480.1 2-polyprenylphenol hydroxylase and related flavodoxin oxidoreductases [Candidatus Scalindua japonica]